MAEPKYQVFVSSTKQDLVEAREHLTWELLKYGFIPVGMENFSAQTDRGWKVIQRTIDLSDYYVVIVAGRYGSIDDETGLSWTRREYEYALGKGIPIFAFVRAMSEIRATDLDHDDQRARLDAFRSHLATVHLREEWTSFDDLGAKVGAALSKAVREDSAEGTPRPGWYRGPAPDLTEFSRLSAEARDLRERLAAQPRNPALAVLKNLPADTPLFVSGMRSGNRIADDYRLVRIDEEHNIMVTTNGRKEFNFPLDKLDTAFQEADGAKYVVAFRPFG
jgi:hypothetical protein